MYREKFDELWEKTVNALLYAITVKQVKGKRQIDQYLQRIVWQNAWGDQRFVPPERKLLEELRLEDPQRALQIEAVLSNIKVSYGWEPYVGIATALLGILLLLVAPGAWRIVAGCLTLAGGILAAVYATQSIRNPKRVASVALARAKKKCDRILL